MHLQQPMTLFAQYGKAERVFCDSIDGKMSILRQNHSGGHCVHFDRASPNQGVYQHMLC